MHTRPAEWEKTNEQKIILLAWPSDENLWQENLLEAQNEFLELVKNLYPQKLHIFFNSAHEQESFAKKIALRENIQLSIMEYGDIWLRDTAPIFLNRNNAVIPKFNGWGNKYLFEKDADLNQRICSYFKVKPLFTSLVFEGGSVEFNGNDLILTTKQCLLNENRNPRLSENEIELELKNLFNVKKIIWISQGLKNDHTDGHIDTIARFIDQNKIVIMESLDKNDENKAVLEQIETELKNQTDFQGKSLEIYKIPSPGNITDDEGELLPASYLNFIITNDKVIVPLYESKYDTLAIESLAKLFKDRKVIGLKAKAILSGGGAFHCISQEYFV